MYFIVVKLICKPEKISELKQQLAFLKNTTLDREPGCRGYAVIDMENNTFVTKELFTSLEDITFHGNQEYVNLFRNVRSDLIDSRTKRTFEINLDWAGKAQPNYTEVYNVDSNTSVDEIEAIPEIFKAVRLRDEINYDRMFVIPEHIKSILTDDIRTILNQENSRPNSVDLRKTSSSSSSSSVLSIFTSSYMPADLARPLLNESAKQSSSNTIITNGNNTVTKAEAPVSKEDPDDEEQQNCFYCFK